MNNIYKVIWSKAKNCYVVASEIARSHTKSASGSEKIGGGTRRKLLASLMALSLLCGGLGVAEASVHVVESGETYEVLTTQEVKEGYGTKADVEANTNNIAALQTKTTEQGQSIATNVANIANNTKAIERKIDTDMANERFAAKADLTALQNQVTGKVDENTFKNALGDKADTDLGNLTDAGKAAIKNAMSEDMNAITTKVNEEKKDRELKDAELSGRIDTLSTTVDSKVSKTDLNTNYYTQAETNAAIKTAVDDEKNARENAINGEVTERNKAIADAIAREETNRDAAITNAKTELKEKVTAEETNRKEEDAKLEGKITENTTAIKNNKDEIARVNGELVKTNAALQATNKRTAGIGRTNTGVEAGNQTVIEGKVYFDQNGNVSDVKDLQTDTIHATGEITSGGLDAKAGDIKTTGKVSAGDISTGTLETTGNATIGGNLDVKGTLNIKDVTAETIRISKSEDNPGYKSEGSISGEGGNLSVSNKKFDKRNNITKESQLNVNEEGTVNWATSTDATGNKTEGRSEVTADNIKNSVKKTEGGKTFGYEENITADGKVGTVTDKEGNTSTTRQDSKGVYGYAKDKDGNKSYTKQEGNRIAESVIGQDGKQTKSEMTSTDITNTAKDGTITNTAKNVTNEGTESVTNKVGTNEVKVSQDGVDIKAEAGKKIKESVGTASRVVENDKITDNAGDSTVTTEKDKGTTFGKAGSTGTTNIYGGSIKTGTINAEDTITDKLTAGAAADAEGGRLTVDADDGIKGSYKSDKYTSKSYILANTLTSGVDNGKKPTDTDFVGSRTDHYMDGDKAKLDETVKDADGSNVTNKTSIGTVTTITDGTNITKTEQGVKDITNTATNGTIKNDARDIVNNASNSITETVGGNNKTEKTADSTKSTIKKGDITTAVKQEGDKIESSIIKDDYSQSNVTTSTVEATANAVTGKDANGNAQTSTVINNKDGLLITNTDNQTSFTTEDRTSTGTAQSWTNIKGNEISTGKVEANYVKMDYADVMKDLGVRGNANITGKTTTGSLEVTGTSTLKGDVTMESNATVKKDLTVEGITTTKTLKVTENATVGGTLDVTQRATFHDAVDIAKDLSVGGNATIAGDVTAKSYKVGDKTYIDANGIHANNQKITNVADGSISEGSKDAVNGGQLYDVKRDMEHKVDKVGANAAAMANLRPMEFDPSSKWNIAAAIGNYGSETAAALGAFYRPNDDVMVNLSTAFGTGENMVGGGVSVRLGKGGNKLSREESNALKAQVADLTARMDALLSVLNPNMSKDFPDVPENHWAYEAVSRLAGNDIIQGYPDGEFHGDRTMTRYEMAEIIYNALSRGAEAEKELVEEFKPELQAMAASEKATAEKAEG